MPRTGRPPKKFSARALRLMAELRRQRVPLASGGLVPTPYGQIVAELRRRKLVVRRVDKATVRRALLRQGVRP